MRNAALLHERMSDAGHGPLIVAELSANHLGSYAVAEATLRAIAATGADAVKLQTYTPEGITLQSDREDFMVKGGTLWDGRSLYDLYGEAQTPWEWHEGLFALADELGLIYFSSPFDHKAVDQLEELDVPLYKIASFEITDLPLIQYAARLGKPMVISTGVATGRDIDLAVEACRSVGNEKVVLLHCISSYPTPIGESNLLRMVELGRRWEDRGVVGYGLSDHSLGDSVAVAATVLGARLIEKHFILDRRLGGPDAAFSMEPEEFAGMVKRVREAHAALGRGGLDELTPLQEKNRVFCRSLYPARDIRAGEMIQEGMIVSVRPGYSLHPQHLEELYGRRAARDIAKGARIGLEDFTGREA